jgi:hypothetical protein
MTDVLALVGPEGAPADEECLQVFRDVVRPGALYVPGGEDPLPELLSVRLAIDPIRAIRRFNAASQKLAKRLLGLTWALVFVEVAQRVVPFILDWRMGLFSTAPSAPA